MLDFRHCEEQSDEAIHLFAASLLDCFASLSMTESEMWLTVPSA